MNRATSRALHRATCRDDFCPACQHHAETRRDDHDPDYDTSAAADQYERQFGL